MPSYKLTLGIDRNQRRTLISPPWHWHDPDSDTIVRRAVHLSH